MFGKIKNIFQKNEKRDSNQDKDSTKAVCKTTEIPIGASKVVSVNNEEIAIFNVNNKFYAIANTCPHHGGPLGEGNCEGTIVTCPWHAWQFDVATGKCITNNTTVKRYEVKINDGNIYI